MDPLDALTESNRKAPAPDTAPAAAAWLRNPDAIDKRKTLLQEIEELANEPRWTGPDYGTPENPAHE